MSEVSTSGALLCMGNPLLDISAEVSLDLLQQYKLEPNNAILAGDDHQPLYKQLVSQYKVQYIAGGATQNTARVTQWMLHDKPGTVTYFGCVGKDQYADDLKASANKDGLTVHYQIDNAHPTGTCAVLITGKNRSMVANLGAASHFDVSHVEKKENWAIVEKAQYYYISAFFLTSSPASIMKVARHAAEKNKIFTMNLAAPFLSMFFKGPLLESAPYWDFIFGNETEAVTFAKEQKFGTEDVKEIAQRLADLPKVNTQRDRIVVITQGHLPTVIAVAHAKSVTEYPVLPVKPEDIVDTNGAGDAFVGGFLSQLVQGKPIADCARAGHYAASVIIQQSGCTFPAKPSF